MAYVAEQKLVKRGNSTAVAIPRTFLTRLGWLCGRRVVLELNDTQDQVVIRLPRQSDYGIPGPPSIRYIDEAKS